MRSTCKIWLFTFKDFNQRLRARFCLGLIGPDYQEQWGGRSRALSRVWVKCQKLPYMRIYNMQKRFYKWISDTRGCFCSRAIFYCQVYFMRLAYFIYMPTWYHVEILTHSLCPVHSKKGLPGKLLLCCKLKLFLGLKHWRGKLLFIQFINLSRAQKQ